MEAAAKPARAGGGSAPDRLSALPDELLRHVLSFLRSRQAVQTTVLSKRWVDLWRSVPAIDLDVTDFPENNSSIYVNWGKMKDFSTKLLMFHSAQFLDAVRLRLGIFDSRNHLRDDVDVWVRCLIKHQPLVLDITVSRSFGLRFQIPLVDSPFRRLKTLELYGVFVDHGFKERLNSGCPVLEDLALHRCRNEFVAIQSDTLKNLVVHGCTCRSELLVIKAPCLISLSLKFPHGCYTNGISLQAGNSLAKASISIYCTELSQSGQTILLGGLSDVTSLELYGFSAMAFLDKELDFPTFDNLRTLSLNWCFLGLCDAAHKFKALCRFLQKSPNLEKLTLQDLWVKPVVGPIELPMLENLRTLFLDSCVLCDNFRILRYFLQRSPNLEKLTVRYCRFPKGADGGKRMPNSTKTRFRFWNLVRFQCHKLKSTEIIYKKGGKIKELVSFLRTFQRTHQ